MWNKFLHDISLAIIDNKHVHVVRGQHSWKKPRVLITIPHIMNIITVLIMYFILIILEPSFLILYIYMVNTLSYYYSTFVILSVYSTILKPAQNLNRLWAQHPTSWFYLTVEQEKMAESTKVAVSPLTGSNYSTWKIQCKMTLIKEDGHQADGEGFQL